MATVTPEIDPMELDHLMIVPEEIETPDLADLFSTNRDGSECVTEDGLDWIWPTDDREPIMFTGKGFEMPPTCVEFISCEEQHGRQTCLEFAFSSHQINPTPVSIGESGIFLITAFVAVKLLKVIKS